MAAISQLADQDFALEVAALYVGGATVPALAEHFGVNRRTISIWIKDPRVTEIALQLGVERASRILRRVDAEMENRLQPGRIEELSVTDLVKVRQALIRSIPSFAAQPQDSFSSEAVTADAWALADKAAQKQLPSGKAT